MPQASFAVMTTVGRAKEAAALANATTITITHIAIGDGATVPSGGETALYHEIARKTISGHGTVVGASNVAYFDCYLSAAEGPYTIREAGLYDDEGDLIAIAHYDPPINKPVPASGQTVEGTVRLEVAFSDVASVTIKVDPSMQVALQRLTRLPWISVKSMSLAAPPALPAVGDTYLIAAAPTGAWTGNAGKIAEYTIVGWAMMTPPEGHGISLPDGRVFEYVDGVYVEKLALDAQSGKWVYALDSGGVNALAVTLSPAPLSLVAGLSLRIKAANSNTGASTLDINTLGAKPVTRRDGSVLLDSDIIAGAIQEYLYDGAKFQLSGASGKPPQARNLHIYVNAAIGNDANDGVSNTAGRAMATIQGAVNRAFSYPPSQYTITIHVADGTYNETVSTPVYSGPNLIITGNAATPSNVIVNGGTSKCFQAQGPNSLTVNNLKVQNSAGGVDQYGFYATAGATIFTSNTVSGAIQSYVFCGSGGTMVPGSHAFSGNCGGYFYATIGGQVLLPSGAVYTISTPITLSGASAQASQAGTVKAATPQPTFVGSSTTGPRYSATLNGIIYTQGGGAGFFPGTSAGSVSSGGQYA